MRGPVQRLLSVVVLVTWMTPGPVALGVGLHLTDHDGHHGRHGHGVHTAEPPGHERARHEPARHEHAAHPHGGHEHPGLEHQTRGDVDPQDAPGDTRSDLLQAALHGHHHGVGDAPEHHHDAIPRSPAPVVRPLPLPLAVVPAATSVTPLIPNRLRRCDRPPGLAPPSPLFHTLCSLLL